MNRPAPSQQGYFLPVMVVLPIRMRRMMVGVILEAGVYLDGVARLSMAGAVVGVGIVAPPTFAN
jgi:hypothetical protein